MESPSAIQLFGTDEPVAKQLLLRAGPLSAILEDGNLRYIRFDGTEVVRAINYLARDGSWGTYQAELSNLVITEEHDRFEIRYQGTCGDGSQKLTYRMSIEGRADGRLAMRCESVALTDFKTNRVGFVILHPASAAGGQLVIEHTDRSREETVFPRHVMADQPAFDIAALTHDPAPGLRCTVRMEGDAFEMEDQRNWTDASFKTYVRPLSKPRPYIIREGERDRQSVEIEITDSRGQQVEASRSAVARKPGRMPTIALFTDESVPRSGYAITPDIANRIILRLDSNSDAAAFVHAANAASTAGIETCFEIVFDARDSDAEARSALALIAAAGIRPAMLLATCRRDFRTRPSDTLPEGEASVGEVIAALRKAGFQGQIGAGTPSNFTEFNRNPPPPECDFIYFAISATVHAADDISVIETLDVYRDVVESARALCPGKPVWLVPCTLAPRHNPYGAALATNPDSRRVAASCLDPRQHALFGAAFAVGIAAEAAQAGVETLSIAAPAGTFGLVDEDRNPYPIEAVHRLISSAAGLQLIDVEEAAPYCRAVAWVRDGRKFMLIANLSPEDADVAIGFPASVSFLETGGWSAPDVIGQQALSIPPYRTVLIRE